MKKPTGVFSTSRLLYYATGKKQRQHTSWQARGKAMQFGVIVMLLFFCSAITQAESRDLTERYNFNIPAQPVRNALSQMARQTQYQLVFSSEMVSTLTSTPIQGEYTVEQALAIVLTDTFLTGRVTKRGVIIIQPQNALNKNGKRSDIMNTRKNLLASTIAFFMGSTGAANVVGQEAGGGQETEGGFVLEEIVVTATKRETSLP